MAEETKTEESSIIEEHKKMVIMTGNLSDFQLKNLKTWPFLLFENLESVEITYDFTKLVGEQEELAPGTVQFDFYFKEKTKFNIEEVKKQLSTLSLWTKFMFWKETKIKFLKSGKKWTV